MCLGEGFRLDRYVPAVVHEGFRALDRLVRILSRGFLSYEDAKQTIRLYRACADRRRKCALLAAVAFPGKIGKSVAKLVCALRLETG